MAAETDRLQGELIEDPNHSELEVERLLMGFLRTLLEEQRVQPLAGASAVDTVSGINA